MRLTVFGMSMIAMMVLNTTAQSADGRWFFSTGVDYSSGDYGETSDTTIVTVPFTAGYVAQRWSAMLTVPIVNIQGPGTIVPGGLGNGGLVGGLLGSTPTSAASGSGVDTTGLGDVSLTASATPYISEGGTQLMVISRIRAATGDVDDALGTGEWAASLSGGFRHPLGQRANVYGSVGYERAFESGSSGIIGALGAESYVADRVQLGAVLNYAQATSDLQRDGAQAGAYVSYDVSQSTRFQAYGAAGLSDTSPDVAAGLRMVFSSD
jgi:hypothetical protein